MDVLTSTSLAPTLQVTGWLLTPALGTPFSEDHTPSFTSNPDMEPIKVQSEGGLNVTLTIRLLMHGKVQTAVFCQVNFSSINLRHSYSFIGL